MLALIVLVAAGVRAAYVLTVTQDDHHFYDAAYYELSAREIAQGEGFFKDPFALLKPGSPVLEAADHPPLTTLVLVPAGLIGDTSASQLAMRFTMVAFGLGVVALVGLLGRELAGDTVGLVAAGIAAVDPNLWLNDGLLMSETLGVLLTTAILLLAYRAFRGTTAGTIVGLGVLSALAVLVRVELGLLAVFVVAPAIWIGTTGGTRQRIERLAACAGCAVILVAPWVAYNMSRFEEPTFISSNDGYALRAANCPTAYDGRSFGYTDTFCVPAAGHDQSVSNAENRRVGLDYVSEHLDRLPVVALARVGRMWSLYRLQQTAEFAEGEGRPIWASHIGTAVLYVLVALAIGGAVALRRRKVRIWPLLAPIVIVTASIALWTGGIPRYRAPAEPSIVVLASVALVALFTRSRSERARVLEPDRSPAGARDVT